MLVSLVLSLTLIPLLVALRLPRSGEHAREERRSRLERALRAGARRLGAPPAGWRCAAALVLAVAAATSSTGGCPSGFLPQMDEGGFVIDYLTPAGHGARGDRPA